MDLSPYVEAVHRDLLRAASLGDENTRRTAATLAESIEPGLRLALMSALSQLAAEVSGVLQTTAVEVRLDGNDVAVTVTQDHQSPGEPTFDAPSPHKAAPTDDGEENWSQAVKDAGGDLSRTTVRLFQDLKVRAEAAATDQGLSLNSYITRAVADALRDAGRARDTAHRQRGGDGRSVTGWIRT